MGWPNSSDKPPSTKTTTSARTLVDPAELNMSMIPDGGTFTITRFGTVWLATKLRFETSGVAASWGYTVRNPGEVGSVTVTFITTSVALGGSSIPRSSSYAVPPITGPTARVSNNRRGGTATKPGARSARALNSSGPSDVAVTPFAH